MQRRRLLCVILLVVSTWTAYGQAPLAEDLLDSLDDAFAEDLLEMRQLEQLSSSALSSMTSSEEDSKDNSTDSDASNGEGEPVDEYDPTPPSNETVQFVPPPTTTVPTPEPLVAPTPVASSATRASDGSLVPYTIAGATIILVIAAAVFALIFRRNRESIHKQEGDHTVAMSEMFLSNRSREQSPSVHVMEVDEASNGIHDSRLSHEVRGSSNDIYRESNLSSPGRRFSFDSDSYRFSGATSSGNSVPVLFDDPPSSSECSSCDHAPIYGSDISDV